MQINLVISTALAASLLSAGSVSYIYFADRLNRPRLLAVGIAVWSLATVGTGLANTYEQLQIARLRSVR